MAYTMYSCKAYNTANVGNNIIFSQNSNGPISYLKDGYIDSLNSTTNGAIDYRISCAHSTWNYSTRTYTISMDNALRNAITSKMQSGGLVNLQNYVSNIRELEGRDFNGNNAMNVYGFICKNNSITGSFDATNIGIWQGSWPVNFPLTVWYSYDIPGVGTAADTITVLCDGWYTRGSRRTIAKYPPSVRQQLSESTLMSPPNNWSTYPVDGNIGPFSPNNTINPGNTVQTLAYYTINGIYSRNTGSRGAYANNAADTILDAGGSYFGNLSLQNLVSLVGAPNERMNIGNDNSITNKIILAITNINFVNNTITVKFAFKHDNQHSMVAFQTNNNTSVAAFRINYSFPITTIVNVTDSWSLTFVNKSDFNPDVSNGTGQSTLIWDSANRAVTLTAGASVNNTDGYSKIISLHAGTLACSCSNVNGTVRLVIGGYSLTIPSNITTFDIRIIATNGGNIGFWRINVPNIGFAHSFSINYPATENAPLVSFENELYTAIVQALNDISVPYLFEVTTINDQYTISVTGLVRCDSIQRDGKTYYTLSIYDVNGDFSSLMVKNGMYVTAPITLTADVQIVNNTILVKAGMSSIGFTSTSIGDVVINIDALAVMLPAVASVSKNGARIGYAATTVNQSSFAFSFSALKDEVDQTDDFVSHYLE